MSADDCVDHRCRNGATCIDRWEEWESDIDYELLILVMITMSASAGKGTEVHTAERKSLTVKSHLTFV